MGKKFDLLTGTRVLEEVESPINGKLTVVRDLIFGTYIKGGGLPQSGGLAEKIWRPPLKRVKRIKPSIESCLVLGLGGGGIVKLLKKHWPEVKILGIEIVPIMISFGKKYLGLDETDLEIIMEDAYKYCGKLAKTKRKFDLICVDVYVGRQVPEKFATEDFIKLVKKTVVTDGIAIFNRLYGKEDRAQAESLHRKLIHAFRKVTPLYPEANVMFVCQT